MTGGERTLTLADVSGQTDAWAAGSFTPAGASAPLDGALRTELSCGSTAPNLLEFRFPRAPGTLTVQAAQDGQASNSDDTLSVGLIVDGKPQPAKNFAFNQQASVQTNLSGVTVVKVAVTDATDPCTYNGSSAALVVVKVSS